MKSIVTKLKTQNLKTKLKIQDTKHKKKNQKLQIYDRTNNSSFVTKLKLGNKTISLLKNLISEHDYIFVTKQTFHGETQFHEKKIIL